MLISPEWIDRVSWEDSKVYVDLSKRHIEAAPEFDPAMSVAREHEEHPDGGVRALGAGRWVASGSVQVFSGSPPAGILSVRP